MNAKRWLGLMAMVWIWSPVAWAVTQGHSYGVTEMTHVDSADQTNNFSAATSSKLVLDGAPSETRVLLKLPADLANLDTNRLAKATLAVSVSTKNYDGRVLRLHPLANAYYSDRATWLKRTKSGSWTNPGGDYLTNNVAASVDTNSNTVTWDLLPLLADTNTFAALLANGALIRLDADNWPADGNFLRVTLVNPNSTNVAQHPAVSAVLIDAYTNARDFAVSYIDSRDSETVYWEQELSTVGKILLNGQDGSECRAILSMPASLTNVNPDRIQSVVAKFDAEINTWSGEKIFLYPITTPTKLVRKLQYADPNPTNGPSWTYADGPVDAGDAAYVRTAWTNAGGGGDWAEAYRVEAAVDNTARTAIFDLTALWKDAAAREMLVANGAIAVMDPSNWPAIEDAQTMPRVNLYRPDDFVVDTRNKHSWIRITEYAALAGGTGGYALPVFYYMDSAWPDDPFFASNTVKVLVNLDGGTETRALLTLPAAALDLDLPTVDSVSLQFNVNTIGDGGETIPILLHPTTRAFGTVPEDAATWNSALTGVGAVNWAAAGGDFEAGTVVTGVYATTEKTLTFDVRSLLTNAGAVAHGLLMRMDSAVATNGSYVGSPRMNLFSNGAQVVVSEKPVAATYVDSGVGYQDSNFSSKTTMKVLLNSDGTECRTLMKLSSALLDVDPLQVGRLNLLLARSGSRSDLSANPVVAHAVTTPFRVGEATWNQAAAGVDWITPGGDYLATCSVGTPNADGSVITFDLAGLLADPDSRGAIGNGVLLRMTGDFPVGSSVMANSVSPLGAAASRPVILQVPAELEAVAATATDDGLVLEVSGLNPLCDYEVWMTTDLTASNGWQFYTNLADATVTLATTNVGCFYRIQQK